MPRVYLTIIIILVMITGCADKSKAETNQDTLTSEGKNIPQAWKKGEASPIQDIRFTTSDGIEIAGSYRKPAGEAGEKAPGLLLIPMLSRTRKDYDEFSARLSESGFASLAIDIRGHGDSTMDGRIRFGRFTDKEWNDCIKDVNAAFGWLSNCGDVDPDYICVLGASIGANFVLKIGSRSEIAMVVALSPGEDYHGVQVIDDAKKIHEKPVYIIVADGDSYSYESSNKLAQVMDPSVELRVIKNNKKHGTQMFEIPFFQEDLIKWLTEKFTAMKMTDLTEKDLANKKGKRVEAPGTAFR
jgi:dienelactone hydrolase